MRTAAAAAFHVWNTKKIGDLSTERKRSELKMNLSRSLRFIFTGFFRPSKKRGPVKNVSNAQLDKFSLGDGKYEMVSGAPEKDEWPFISSSVSFRRPHTYVPVYALALTFFYEIASESSRSRIPCCQIGKVDVGRK